MPQLHFQKYIDRDYEDKQLSLAEISGRVIKINLGSIRVKHQIIKYKIFTISLV